MAGHEDRTQRLEKQTIPRLEKRITELEEKVTWLEERFDAEYSSCRAGYPGYD